MICRTLGKKMNLIDNMRITKNVNDIFKFSRGLILSQLTPKKLNNTLISFQHDFHSFI